MSLVVDWIGLDWIGNYTTHDPRSLELNFNTSGDIAMSVTACSASIPVARDCTTDDQETYPFERGKRKSLGYGAKSDLTAACRHDDRFCRSW